MSEETLVSFQNLDSNKTAFQARIKRCDFTWKSGSERLKGDFFYLPFRNGNITTDYFLKFLITEIIKYALPYKDRAKALQHMSPSNLSHIIELKEQAKSFFLCSDTASEFGELILYIILRDFFDAPQVANKMVLKTSGNMPIHGSDGLHVKFDNDIMTLYHGESKMYADTSPNAAITSAISSSKDFLLNTKTKNGSNARDFEIQLIDRHFSLPGCSEEQKAAIMAYFNPLKPQSNNSKDVAVCLVGFDMNFYKQAKGAHDIETLFLTEYKDKITAAAEHFKNTVRNEKLENYNFHFLLLPFDSLSDFRDKFLKALDEY